ncbi:MAG TPA: transglycosylase family protein [Thermoleophilaceae bacterium]|nr:transglycosylase family protein [Thermoleophilaceae bacterium]
MRRLLAPALSAVVIAAPIPVALAQTGPDVGEVVANAVERKVELRKEARAAKRAAERRVAEKRAARKAAAVPAVAVNPHLETIAQCESGGDPTAVSPDGMYHGKYQFSVATWQAMGGAGLPSQAPEAEQDMRAQMLYEQSGPGQWPVCGA